MLFFRKKNIPPVVVKKGYGAAAMAAAALAGGVATMAATHLINKRIESFFGSFLKEEEGVLEGELSSGPSRKGGKKNPPEEEEGVLEGELSCGPCGPSRKKEKAKKNPSQETL